MNLADPSAPAPGNPPAPAPAAPPEGAAPSAGSPSGEGGIWAALARHLSLAEYRPVQSPAVTAIAMTTRHGEAYHLLANRDRGRYARLSPDEFHIWQLMDGTRTVKDLIFEYFTAFQSLAFDVVTQLVVQLRREFMLADAPRDIDASLARAVARRSGRAFRQAVWQVITGRRTFQIHHIDALMGALHRRAAWALYATPLQVVYVALAVLGGLLFLRHYASGRYELFQAGGSYGMGLLLLVALNVLCVVVHEASHALTCKHYGGQVHRAGLMLYFGLPTAFVDTTDIWTKPVPARLATTWAGPYSGVILAGAGAIVVQAMPDAWAAPILHRLSFLWLLTFLFNVIPFLELDGYYMAVDWLEMPLLRGRALTFFRTELWDRLRRGQRLTGQERLLAWFGGLSVLFSGLVLCSAFVGWQARIKTLAAALWAGGLGSKALLALLLLSLGFPLAAHAAAQAGAAGRRLTAWTRRLRMPHGHALRERRVLLQQVHCLSALSPAALTEAASGMRHHLLRPGQIVVRQGADPDRFYIVERGVAEMWVDGEPRARRRLARGDYFGETALLEREPYAATFRAGSWLSLFSMRRSDFDRWVGPYRCAEVDDRLSTVQALRRFPIFAALPARQLDALAAKVVREHVAPGAVVCPEGCPVDAMYFIESGQADIVAGGEHHIVGPGRHFGEGALFGRAPQPDTVKALTPLDLLKFPHRDFDAVVTTSPGTMTAGDPQPAPAHPRRVCCATAAAPTA
jgi:putative peptide zinc metalloprotease protein